MAHEVRLTSGELKNFAFPSGTGSTNSITANQDSLPMYKDSPYTTFQTILTSTTFGALTATVNILATNDVWTGTGFVINNCTTTSSSTTVTHSLNQFGGGTEQLNDLVNPAVAVGMIVVGPGIPSGTYVSAVTNTGNITLSAAATATSSTASLRFFNKAWVATALGTTTLSGTTSATAPFVSDGFSVQSSWKFVKASVTNITGTGATVNVVMGV